ncbi:MAG: 2'-deoxycytidine 5'-triphosphate deaminase [Acidimicrobiia bacterium]|nr:2'-deoxycytidine 5'-triphosphate deaminase [Acidimicrobiia bacterium]
MFTRVITDHGHRFDEIRDGYSGPLYLEIVPLSFTVIVRAGLSLNQLRLIVGDPWLSDDLLRERHKRDPLLFRGGAPLAPHQLTTDRGIFLGLDLEGAKDQRVGWSARPNTAVLEMAREGYYHAGHFWEPVVAEHRAVILEREQFYLLLSEETIAIPPDLAAEMTAYDPTSGDSAPTTRGSSIPGSVTTPTGRCGGRARRPRGPGPRRPVPRRARPEGVQADLRAAGRAARAALRRADRLELPGPGRRAGQALPGPAGDAPRGRPDDDSSPRSSAETPRPRRSRRTSSRTAPGVVGHYDPLDHPGGEEPVLDETRNGRERVASDAGSSIVPKWASIRRLPLSLRRSRVVTDEAPSAALATRRRRGRSPAPRAGCRRHRDGRRASTRRPRRRTVDSSRPRASRGCVRHRLPW